MRSLAGKQSATKASGRTFHPTGELKGEWSVENYATDNTEIVTQTGESVRSYLNWDGLKFIVPRVIKNPNRIPKDPNVIPANPNVIPKDPNVIPLNPNPLP